MLTSVGHEPGKGSDAGRAGDPDGRDLFIVMGAKVQADGRPSGALRRRSLWAADLAVGARAPLYLLTGGVLRGRPAEALVAREILRGRGISDDALIVETESKTTLESVVRTTPIILSLPRLRRVIVCSDGYHVPRCRLLFALAGVRTHPASVPGGRRSMSALRWAYACTREAAAIPVDAALLLAMRALGALSP